MAAISVTTPDNGFSVTTPNTSFKVTTPESQVIDVGETSIIIDIATTTNTIDITEVGITNTDQLIEGSTNLFFTTARARASFAAGTGVTIVNGNISIGQAVATTSQPTFEAITLSQAPVNPTQAVTKQYVDQAVSAANIQSTDELAEGITNLYYTEQRVEDHVFEQLKIDNKLVIDTSTEINTNEATTQIIDSWSKALYRTVKYIIQATQSTRWQCVEALVIHDGTDAYITQFADIKTGDNIISNLTAQVVGSQVNLSVLPTSSTATTFRVTKILMTI